MSILSSLSLRSRLAVLIAGLVLGVGVLLVSVINIAASFVIPSAATQSSVGVPGAIDHALLRQLQVISSLGLLASVIVGSASAYWLAGRALSPIHELSQAARQVTAKNLTNRLDLSGPDDALKELSLSFNAMLERLDRSFEQQRRFVGDAAHELRTPLAVLRTNLEVVQSDPGATLPDYQQVAAILERAVARLEALVGDLLVLAMEERSPADEEVFLGPLLEDVREGLSGLAAERQVALHLEGDLDVVVRGDSLLLSHAAANLIENGIRYNHPGGMVTITVGQEDSGAVVTVADTGVGIPQEEQGKIFERFYRADNSRSRHTGGAGLGLAIVDQVVRRHGGEIAVTSAPGEGSVFKVRLPLVALTS